jgi:hypothetical protein
MDENLEILERLDFDDEKGVNEVKRLTERNIFEHDVLR